MQSKRLSIIETVTNVIVGWIFAMIANATVFPFLGINIPLDINLKASVCFVIISIIRGYGLRRLFNAIGIWLMQKENIKKG